MKEIKGKIKSIAGPLVVAENMRGSKLFDLVKVGKENLLGEIIQLQDDLAWIQVYEDTTGITTSEPVESQLKPLSVQLGPGMIGRFYDGIQRPLSSIYEQSGNFISRGIQTEPIDMDKKWDFTPVLKKGGKVIEGDVLGEIKETKLITHKILVPQGVKGTLQSIKSGKLTNKDAVAEIKTENGLIKVPMSHSQPIRIARKFKNKLAAGQPLFTGQRVIDTFFPITRGGVASIPGPFGSGKTVTQQQLAKWSDAEIVVYVGCGERGNEMTDVLHEFAELKDPKSGEPLMDRTVLIANTSNMPIAAREASIYTGITIAEYFRDMGYDVALMADSTSRWAEALREISSRLEEMPGEEGYPAYLASRIADFYERAGLVNTLGSGDRQGSVTVVGAVSPPGGDLSEPVSQSTLAVTKVFWALDSSLAKARHYPAVHWLNSYSLYTEYTDKYIRANIDEEFPELRSLAMDILQKESDLEEVIRIVGSDSLSREDRLLLLTSGSLREDMLQQNAFDLKDAYTSFSQQILMIKVILHYYKKALSLIKENPDLEVERLLENKITDNFVKLKFMKESDIENLDKQINNLLSMVTSTQKLKEDSGFNELITHREEASSE